MFASKSSQVLPPLPWASIERPPAPSRGRSPCRCAHDLFVTECQFFVAHPRKAVADSPGSTRTESGTACAACLRMRSRPNAPRAPVLALFAVACGGQAVETTALDDPCVCPDPKQEPPDDCSCSGLTCSFPPAYTACWRGEATCSPEGHWVRSYPQNTMCPEEPASPGLCNGRGTCAYDTDVGCGPARIEASCSCTDASWLAFVSERPPLCDCAAIASRAVCRLYSSDCSWSEENLACELAP